MAPYSMFAGNFQNGGASPFVPFGSYSTMPEMASEMYNN